MTNPMMGLNAAEGRRREEAARQRRERNTPSAEVRAIRARILEEREAAMAEQQAAAQAAREASPDALQAVLSRGTLDELAEITRMISRLDGRRMQDIVNEVFRAKSRTAYVAPVAAEPETPLTPPVAEAPEKPAGESVRRRGARRALGQPERHGARQRFALAIPGAYGRTGRQGASGSERRR